MRYRRARIGGATYFFTVNLADRRGCLLVEHVGALREAVRRATPLAKISSADASSRRFVWTLRP